MASQQPDDVARAAEFLYQQRLKKDLEASHGGEFVAVEPTSGDYFLGRTLSEAIGAARKAHPDRLVHALRIGHTAAVHFGAASTSRLTP